MSFLIKLMTLKELSIQMKKIRIPDIGEVIYWNDFVKFKASKNPTEETVYKQSNTKVDTYHPRTIGLYKSEDWYYVAVSTSNKPTSAIPVKIAKGMINSRLREVIKNDRNIEVSNFGCTTVPASYLDLLWKDSAAYNYLYGPLDPTMLDMAVKLLES